MSMGLRIRLKVVTTALVLMCIAGLSYYFFSLVNTAFSPIFANLFVGTFLGTTAIRQDEADHVAIYLLILTVFSAFWTVFLLVLICVHQYYQRSPGMQLLTQVTAGLCGVVSIVLASLSASHAWRWWRFFDTLPYVSSFPSISRALAGCMIAVAGLVALLLLWGAIEVCQSHRRFKLTREAPTLYHMERMDRATPSVTCPEATPSSSTILRPTPRDGRYTTQTTAYP